MYFTYMLDKTCMHVYVQQKKTQQILDMNMIKINRGQKQTKLN